MRKQHDIIHRDQFGGDLRLFGENVEARRHDALVLERLDQGRLVDHRAARHIDHDAVRSERVEHFALIMFCVAAPPGTITISVSTSRAMSISFG